jgi:hypothetical protein
VLPLFLGLVLTAGLVVLGVSQLQACLTSRQGLPIPCLIKGKSGSMSQITVRLWGCKTCLLVRTTCAARTCHHGVTFTRASQQVDGLSAVIICLGSLLAFTVAWARLEAIIKPISACVEEKLKLVQFPDHSAKTGYHHTVRVEGHERGRPGLMSNLNT